MGVRYRWVVAVGAGVWFSSMAGSAQEPRATPSGGAVPRRFAVSRARSEIEVDGRLVEAAWKDAALLDLPYEWYPGENVDPPVTTECLITYDDTHLFVGFRAYDPEPEKIRAHLMDRDQVDTLVQDDYVGFLLDTFDDQRRAFQFRVNPLGVQAEALNSTSSEDWEWDILWDSAGRMTGEGYTVEVAIPFNQLRFPHREGELTFGWSAMRSWPRNVRHRMTSHYTDFNDSCGMCQYNKVTGFEELSPGRNIELDPTLTSSRTDEREDLRQGNLEKGDVEVDPGVTVRWGISPNLTLNGTVNPDFSQVEADVAQLEVNERFALFFPEKRPFFLEGVDYFHTPRNAVFTRTVADPTWGAKLTGKLGVHGLGVFLTRDRLNNLVIPSNQLSRLDSVAQDVTAGVVRYRRDVGRSSTLGALYAGREASDYHNRVAGFDGVLQLAGAETIKFQYLYSDTLYPEEVAERQGQRSDAFSGSLLSIEYQHDTRTWFWAASWEDLSPEIRADSGFIPRVDVRTARAWVGRNWWGGPDASWAQFHSGIEFSRTEDHGGTLTNREVEIWAVWSGPMQANLWAAGNSSREYFNGETFDLNTADFHADFQPVGAVKMELEGALGDEIDSFNTRKGKLFNLRPAVELKLGRHVNLNLKHSFQRLDVEGRRLFAENLTDARIFYYFDVRKLIRLIVQYRSIDRDPALFSTAVEAKQRSLFLQFLASYKLNPRTVVFIGYSDQFRGGQVLSLTRANRTFFVKLGYAWTL